jgi:OOP family OmpA-OmpF porin
MTLRSVLLGTAFAVACGGALGGTAQAAQINGWYVSLEGGANWIEDWDHSFFATPSTASFDTGWAVLASVGYGWNGWRLEFESGYRENDLETYTLGPAVFTGLDGDLWEATFMANVLYDIQLTNNFSLSLGVGAGGDFADGEVTLGALTFEDDDWNFAYQGIAGLNWAVGQQTSLFVNYHYLRVVDAEFDFRPPLNAFLNNADDIVKHTVSLGLRYAFDARAEPMAYEAPPAPASAPMAAPRQFIVFFGFNKYNLTSEALRVISEAVVSAKETGSASVLITGHTDTVGSGGYNQQLSMRRSNAVKGEMVRQGVPVSAITSTGKGETELLVQTADGVKEPQNRRATIDLN